MELNLSCKLGEFLVKNLLSALKKDNATLTGCNASHNKNVLDVIELCVVSDSVAEVCTDGVIDSGSALVAVLHKSLNDLELFSESEALVKLDACKRSKLDNAVLREVLNSAAVVARPLVDHSVLAEIYGNECKLVEPTGDVALGVNVAACLGRAHSNAENRVVVKIHSTCKRGNVAVVCNLDRNVLAKLLGNVKVHILNLALEILVAYLEEERSDHNSVVDVNACAGYADSVNAGHMRCGSLHSLKNAVVVVIGIGVGLGEPYYLL